MVISEAKNTTNLFLATGGERS